MTSIYTDTRLVNLNSAYCERQNGDYLSDVRFNFTGLLQDDPDIQEVQLQIQNAQIPYSFYNINVYNNVLKVSVDGLPTVYTLTLTRGNYNANSLITELTTQFTNAGLTGITITISSITGLLKFTKTSGSLTLRYSGSTLMKVLGFLTTQDYTSVAQVLDAPYPLNLLGILKIKIASFDLVTNNYDSQVGGSLNVLATIPIEAGNFGLILYDNVANIQSILRVPTLDGFDIKLYGDDGNLINFNGIDWSITLVMTLFRKRSDKTAMSFKDIVKPINQLVKVEKQVLETLQAQQPTDQPDQGISDQTEEQPQDLGTEAPEPDDETDLELLFYNNGQTL